MKNEISNNMKRITRLLLLVVSTSMYLYTNENVAQVQQNGVEFIGDNTVKHLAEGNFNFGDTPAVSVTSRTAGIYGKLSFANGTGWLNATDDHFLDGYAAIYSDEFFVLPVGQSGVFGPLGIEANDQSGVDGAFYFSDPSTIGNTLGSGLSFLSTREYWHVVGENEAKITLTWRIGSNISALTAANLDNLTIVGWDGAAWIEIPSIVDTNSMMGSGSDLNSGSITSIDGVDLNTISHVTFGSRDGCPPLIPSSGITKTWNGAWDAFGAPTLEDPVVINAPYSGTLQCNSLELNADITLVDGEYVEIVNGVEGTGKIIMRSESSVVQRNPLASSPNIELTKTTRDMRRWDYVYWGTPIQGNFFNQLNGASAQGYATTGAFDAKYKYVSGPPPNAWQTLTEIETGKGYIMRVKQQAPFTNSTNTGKIDLDFVGEANNGDIIVPVVNNPSSPNGATSKNLIANPYPSAIDAAKFLRQNTDIDGAVYLWTSATVIEQANGSYTQADYAIWNLSGTVNTSPSGQLVDGRIASGQGFKVKSLVNNGSVIFTNCMRLVEDNNNFFRMSEPTTPVVDRFKLNLTNDSDVFSQILIAYIPEATYGYDRLFDAVRNSVSTAQLYSRIENDSKRIAINGRPSFEVSDVVPLGVSKNNTNAEQFTISIEQKEGIFQSSDVTVYLHDKDLQVYHNLNLGGYVFTVNQTGVNNRFEVVYQDETLSNPVFESNSTLAMLNNNLLVINATIEMENVQVFDLTGRLIEEFSSINQSQLSKPFHHAEAVYIAKVKLSNGTVSSHKLINANK